MSISPFWGINGQRFGKFPFLSRSTLFYGCLWRFDIKRIVQCFNSFFLVLGCAVRVTHPSPTVLVQVSFMCGGRAQNDVCRVSNTFVDCSQFPKKMCCYCRFWRIPCLLGYIFLWEQSWSYPDLLALAAVFSNTGRIFRANIISAGDVASGVFGFSVIR